MEYSKAIALYDFSLCIWKFLYDSNTSNLFLKVIFFPILHNILFLLTILFNTYRRSVILVTMRIIWKSEQGEWKIRFYNHICYLPSSITLLGRGRSYYIFIETISSRGNTMQFLRAECNAGITRCIFGVNEIFWDDFMNI